ncbi:hypothetical protein A8135_12000 [Legionella jamestowniensis]|uniref:Transmembrane protein n=1 Tax=Legionella jamestowniensis TaxID=455 RepID=A0ABX2XUI2_9GAMM|nr:hypothetical protein [Legionella jamestowniensis]OCH98274.1 hypothetical protein A8135_12000 [Legionella jamestowniensis]
MKFSHPIQMIFGLVIWSIWFILMYSFLSIGCSVALFSRVTRSGINISLFACTWVTLIILVYLAYHCWKTRKSLAEQCSNVTAFVLWVGLGGYVTAILATFSIGMMVLFFPPCL